MFQAHEGCKVKVSCILRLSYGGASFSLQSQPSWNLLPVQALFVMGDGDSGVTAAVLEHDMRTGFVRHVRAAC